MCVIWKKYLITFPFKYYEISNLRGIFFKEMLLDLSQPNICENSLEVFNCSQI